MSFTGSADHAFSFIERMQQRALQLVHGGEPPPVDDDLRRREAESLAQRVELRLPRLMRLLELPPLASDLMVCLLLAELEPFSRALIRALQREGGRPWLEVGTIAELLQLPRERLPELADLLARDAPLSRWRLVERESFDESGPPLVSLRVKIPATVARFLIGDDRLGEGLSLRPAQAPSQAVPAALLSRIRRALLRDEPLVVEIVGRPNTGRHGLAAAIADEVGCPLLTADFTAADTRRLEARLDEGKRDARLHGAILCLRNLDAATPAAQLAEEERARAASPQLPAALASFFGDQSGLVLITAEEPQPLLGMRAQTVLQVNIPFPSPSERARLLAEALEQRGMHPVPDVDLSAVTRRFALDPLRIENAARAAVELTQLRDPDATSVLHADLLEACRRQVRHDLKSLATRVNTSHRWEDLVIPVDVYESLIEIIAYVRHADRVYDEWGFAARHSLSEGVSALFTGPPGTGKTMCASVVARELDMELFRVDLSRVVSKWIGETEKNLSKVFDEAEHSNAIILFDEADSLFAKRTEVKSSVDRYANLEVNYLLQRMECFGGVTILTTNFEDTIDTAFKRRLTFRMRFEKPDADARAALWRKVFPSATQLGEDFDPDLLGRTYEMSGGNIRSAAVRAAFFAAAGNGTIDQAICMRAAEREAREMGILLRSAQRDRNDLPPERVAESDARPRQPPPRLVPLTHPRR